VEFAGAFAGPGRRDPLDSFQRRWNVELSGSFVRSCAREADRRATRPRIAMLDVIVDHPVTPPPILARAAPTKLNTVSTRVRQHRHVACPRVDLFRR
jgi:hypothetical protein